MHRTIQRGWVGNKGGISAEQATHKQTVEPFRIPSTECLHITYRIEPCDIKNIMYVYKLYANKYKHP